jgi:hypothetical protein
MRTVLAALALAFLLPATAAADPTPDVGKMTSDDCARARKLNKTCVLTIEDETIEGTSPTAGEPPISVPDFTSHASLIRIRTHFIPEILKSAEDL